MMSRIEVRATDQPEIYCSECGRTITADNVHLVEAGEHERYMFIHDDISHEDVNIK